MTVTDPTAYVGMLNALFLSYFLVDSAVRCHDATAMFPNGDAEKRMTAFVNISCGAQHMYSGSRDKCVQGAIFDPPCFHLRCCVNLPIELVTQNHERL